MLDYIHQLRFIKNNFDNIFRDVTTTTAILDLFDHLLLWYIQNKKGVEERRCSCEQQQQSK